MFFCIEAVENPLVFIRDRLDSQITLQREASEQKIRAETGETTVEDKSESNKRDEKEEAAGSSETVISADCAEEVDVDPESEHAAEIADVSDYSMIEEPKLQTIIEKDEAEAQRPIAVDYDNTSAVTPRETVQNVPEAEQTAASENAFIPGEEEPSMPADVNNDNIVFEIGKDIMETVFGKVDSTIETDEDDQPDYDEAVPFYDSSEEVEGTQLEQIIKDGEVEATFEMEEEQKEDDENEDAPAEKNAQEPEVEQEAEEEQVEAEEDQLDSQCISAPKDSAGVEADDADTSESALYDDSSAEIAAELKALEVIVSKRKLSILPDDAETVYLLSKSFKLDPDTPSEVEHIN